MHSSPTRVEVSVDLAAFAANLRRIRQLIHRRVKLMIAVKKNAYGHGIAAIARAAERYGVDWLGVFSAHEGLALRRAGIRLPVLVFSVTPRDELQSAIKNRLTLTVTNAAHCKAVDRAASRVGVRASVHLKLDTGMGRLGFDPGVVLSGDLDVMHRCRNVQMEGVYSHLADADSDRPYSRRQLAKLIEFVRAAKHEFGLVHIGASSALPHPEWHLDMVRVGIGAYGGHHSLAGFKPVMLATAPVLQVKEVPARTSISYGRTFTTKRRSRIAIVGAGYGDGYLRALGNRGWVCLRGRSAPIVGRVCMDQFMVDVTRVRGVVAGDRAELIGTGVSVSRLAEAAETISYELLCSLGNRVVECHS